MELRSPPACCGCELQAPTEGAAETGPALAEEDAGLPCWELLLPPEKLEGTHGRVRRDKGSGANSLTVPLAHAELNPVARETRKR